MQELVKELEARTGISTRLTVLGLVQRGVHQQLMTVYLQVY